MDLQHAAERLYEAFAAYPRRAEIEACPCCVGTAEETTLARVPLRSLSCEALADYGFNAMTTWGLAEDYKHFLPRILELEADRESEGFPGLAQWLVAEKLDRADWRRWPEAERRAVETFLPALWRDVLTRDPTDRSAGEALWGIAHIAGDLSPYLEAWSRDESSAAALHLADFILSAGWDLVAPREKSGWHGLVGRKAVRTWLTDPQRGRVLERAFAGHVDDPAGARLAEAIDTWSLLDQGVP